MSKMILSVAGIALAVSTFAALPALANGGDFFNELSESWGANTDTGVPYFGWVRDARGKPIARAIVTATVTNGADGQSVTIISDNLGHYKIPGLGKDVNPKNVVIDCAKAGYRAVGQDRRVLRTLPKAPVEVSCKLAPIATTS
ncbi:MAG: carboxypeptidase regulatory-like domain-containing protein [Alphaproteobacteria bacterium]|nr:carboxypeptidase regulatory-like domain-containing protein [Alphaproteobacteria bacterium]